MVRTRQKLRQMEERTKRKMEETIQFEQAIEDIAERRLRAEKAVREPFPLPTDDVTADRLMQMDLPTLRMAVEMGFNRRAHRLVNALEGHARNTHQTVVSLVAGRVGGGKLTTGFQCDWCKNYMATSLQEMVVHLNIHIEGFGFHRCDLCAQLLGSKVSLDRHLENHLHSCYQANGLTSEIPGGLHVHTQVPRGPIPKGGDNLNESISSDLGDVEISHEKPLDLSVSRLQKGE